MIRWPLRGYPEPAPPPPPPPPAAGAVNAACVAPPDCWIRRETAAADVQVTRIAPFPNSPDFLRGGFPGPIRVAFKAVTAVGLML